MTAKSELWRNGKFVRTLENGEQVRLQDGESIRVPRLFMDARDDALEPLRRVLELERLERQGTALHAPGFAALCDADRDKREDAIAAYRKRLSEAWKNPRPQFAEPAAAQPSATSAMEDAQSRYEARIREAWRHAR